MRYTHTQLIHWEREKGEKKPQEGLSRRPNHGTTPEIPPVPPKNGKIMEMHGWPS